MHTHRAVIVLLLEITRVARGLGNVILPKELLLLVMGTAVLKMQKWELMERQYWQMKKSLGVIQLLSKCQQDKEEVVAMSRKTADQHW